MRFSMILIMRHYPPAMPIESSVLGAMANFSSVKVDSLEPQTPQASEEHNDHIDVPSHTLYEYVWTYGMPRHPFEELATLSASLLTSYSPATKAQVSIVWRHPRAPTCSTPVVRQHHMCSADTRGALCKNHGKTNECINCLKHAHILSPIHARFDKKNSLSLDILLNLAFQSFHKPSGPWDLQGWERSYDWGINLELLIAKLSLGEHSPALWIFDDFWITSTVTQPIPRDRHPNILSLLPQILKFLWWDWLKLNGSNMFKRIIPNTWMLHDASINILSKIKYGQIHSNTKHDTSVHGYPNFDHHHPSRRNNAFCPATCCSDLGWAGLKSMAHWKIHTICRQELTGTDRNHIWDWHFKESLTKAPPWTTWQIFSWLVNSRGICASRYK